MNKIIFGASLMVSSLAFSATKFELKESDFNSSTKTINSAPESIVLSLESTDLGSDLQVSVASEEFGTTCWFQAPIQKTVYKDSVRFQVNLGWDINNSDDHGCTYKVQNGKGKYVFVKLSPYN
jgi:hypothetical protein